MSRAGLGSWSCLGADKVQEKFQVHPCQVALNVGWECSSSCEGEVSVGRKSVFSSELEPSQWMLAAHGAFFSARKTS